MHRPGDRRACRSVGRPFDDTIGRREQLRSSRPLAPPRPVIVVSSLVKAAFHDTDTDDPRKDVGVGVGVVECGLKPRGGQIAGRAHARLIRSVATINAAWRSIRFVFLPRDA